MAGTRGMNLAQCRVMRVLMVEKGIDFLVLVEITNMMDLGRIRMKEERPSTYNIHSLCCVLDLWLMFFTNGAL
jgi:hypothetical protein